MWKYIVSPHMRKARRGREREKLGTTDKVHAFDSSRPTHWFWSVKFLSSFKSIKGILWDSFSHWAVISSWHIFDSFWQIAMEEPITVTRYESNAKSKAKALSLVPHFSLSLGCPAFLTWGDTMYFCAHLHLTHCTIPEGKWGTTHSLNLSRSFVLPM